MGNPMNKLLPPTVMKSEFWGGPKDGDRAAVPDRNVLLAYTSLRDDSEVHVYGYSAARGVFEYVGLMSRAAWTGVVFKLQVGVER